MSSMGFFNSRYLAWTPAVQPLAKVWSRPRVYSLRWGSLMFSAMGSKLKGVAKSVMLLGVGLVIA